jgi:hypothetical protein
MSRMAFFFIAGGINRLTLTRCRCAQATAAALQVQLYRAAAQEPGAPLSRAAIRRADITPRARRDASTGGLAHARLACSRHHDAVT